MRTTVTLDPDVAAQVQALMRERGFTFKEAINQTLRAGLGRCHEGSPYQVPAHDLGLAPGVDLTKALKLASELHSADTDSVRLFDQRRQDPLGG